MLTRLPAGLKRLAFGGDRRFCPVCGRGSRRFLPFGAPRRTDAQCVWCASLERHRLFWLHIQRQLPAPGAMAVLHVAPEACLEPRLRSLIGAAYVTADVRPGRADLTMDVMNIQ